MLFGRFMKLLPTLIFGFQLLNPQIQEAPKFQVSQELSKSQIESKIQKDYGLDTLKNLNFEVLPDDKSLGVLGIYSPWSDSLKINYYGIIRSSQRNNFSADSILARTMRHELAHYRVDKMQEKLGLESKMENKDSRNLIEAYLGLLQFSEQEQGLSKELFQSLIDNKCEDLTNILIDRIINEGIAKYYENPNFKPAFTVWPISIKNIKNSDEYNMHVYDVGWNLMRPIISAYGDKGIEHVLNNMPKYKDFSDLEGYQKMVLEELAEKK